MVKKQERNRAGSYAVCWELWEATMGGRVRPDCGEETVRPRSWGRMQSATGDNGGEQSWISQQTFIED